MESDTHRVWRKSDSRLVRQFFSSFTLVVVLGIFAYGIYSRQRPVKPPLVLGAEIVNTPSPTPTPTGLPLSQE